MEMKKEYSNEEITVVWKPGVCFHAGECVKGSPSVFKPKEKPWIQMEHDSTENIMAAIDKCPSGALSYYKNGEQAKAEPEATVEVQMKPNGPIVIHGAMTVVHEDGSTETKGPRASFCRCTKSANMPFCDGAHKNL